MYTVFFKLLCMMYTQECSREDIESILYTIKEVNSVAGCNLYTAACICTVDQLMLVKETSQKVFINTEILFWCDDSNKDISNW